MSNNNRTMKLGRSRGQIGILTALLVVSTAGALLWSPITAHAEDKPKIGKPIITKDPPKTPPKHDDQSYGRNGDNGY
jgi:hypothetical protein